MAQLNVTQFAKELGVPPAQLIELVRRIESSSNLVVIETSTVRSNQDNATFALGMNAYYRLPAQPETKP